jgi:xylose isomerase
MRNYLILAEKAQAFRADPEVQAARAAAGCDELAVPTRSPGETLAELRAEAFDPGKRAERGAGYDRLDQLAVEHLFGVR